MVKSFNIVNHMDKPVVQLQVINDYSNSDVDVKCICGDNVVNIRNYFGLCSVCKREYGGPILQK